MPYLHVILGDSNGSRFELAQPEVSIGREPSNTLVVPDAIVAPRHAVLVRRGDGHLLRGAGSAGLAADDGPTPGRELRHGDLFSIGSAEFVYCADSGDPQHVQHRAAATPFTPSSPPASFAARIFWPFTKEGRARRHLLLARERPEDGSRLARLESVASGLLENAAKLGPSARGLLEDTLSQLAWAALRRGETVASAKYIDQLQRAAPSSDAVVALRWDLMAALRRSENRDAYARQAESYLANAKLAIPAYADAVRAVVRTVYEWISPGACKSALAHAHATISSQAELKPVRVLCDCPAEFQDPEEAERWARQIPLGAFGFSKVMAADATLVAARAAESRGDWREMLDAALRALRLAPSHFPVLYWLARAKLHLADSHPTDHLPAQLPVAGAAWDRLAILAALHQHPTLAAANAARPILQGEVGTYGHAEVNLVIDLVQRAIETAPAATLSELETAALLCSAVEDRAGARSWVHVPIARWQVRVRRAFRAAYERLESDDARAQPGAVDVARIARILAGEPSVVSSAVGGDPLSTIERSMHQLLASTAGTGEAPHTASARELRDLRRAAIVEAFPDLAQVIDVLALAQHLVSGEIATVWASLAELPPPESSLPWLTWIHARVSLVAKELAAPLEPLPVLLRSELVAVAWILECWTYNHSRVGVQDEVSSADATATLDAWTVSTREGGSQAVAAVREARRRRYGGIDIEERRTAQPSVYPELGSLVDALCAGELRLEIDYAVARAAIAAATPEIAVRRLQSLNAMLDQLPALTLLWWRPLLSYWYGVALAQARRPDAPRVLESLLDGARAHEARGQLGLLALEQGHLDVAVRVLGEASDRIPGVRYANAVAQCRLESWAEAREMLEGPASARVFAGSAYERPAQRLAAAVEERTGRRNESARLLRALVDAHHDDSVSLARLGRSLLVDAYAHFQSDGSVGANSMEDVAGHPLSTLSTSVAWWRGYALLHRLLTDAPEAVGRLSEELRAHVSDSAVRWGWRQVAGARLLRAGRPDASLTIVHAGDDEASPQLARARSILRAWQSLTMLSGGTSTPELSDVLARCAQRLAECPAGDTTALYWRALADFGAALVRGSTNRAVGEWSGTVSGPMADVAALFAASADQRRVAADSLRAALARDGGGWTEEQQLLLAALAAWAVDDDDDYLRQIGYLEQVLGELPVSARDLWVPAALLRYARGDWASLSGESLPECLADMSDPMVCLIVELADARATIGDLRNPNQRVAQKVKGIRRNLEALVERLNPPPPEPGLT